MKNTIAPWLSAIRRAAVLTLVLGGAGCQPWTVHAPVASRPGISESQAQATQGRVETVTLVQTSLGVPKAFKVYVPAGYPGGGPYPTLYLMRGTMDEWLNPDQDDSRRGRTAVSVYESLRRAGTVGDLIFVFPGLGSDDGQWPAILTNWIAPEKAAGVGNGRFADYLFKDVIPQVDKRFRTVGARQHPAIDGFSLGGWAAVQAAVTHPEVFASVGGFDGTYPFAKSAKQVAPDDELWQMPFFDPVFGQP
ncbi:MAG: hypothetical protein H7338_16890, partial [Candidatus Sericytochromatia bacterium]|nr:hypothetical protein [Candidatus Sericytochromatia bacterium]